MVEDKDKDDEDKLDEENKKFRTVKYHQHGILSKTFNTKTKEEIWIFENSGNHFEYETTELIDILDNLSEEGYELVCSSDGDYVLRTKNEVEEVQEYWDMEPLRCKRVSED